MWNNTTKPSQNIEYIATQALDFLITQDGKKLITNQSTIWTRALKAITNWVNLNK